MRLAPSSLGAATNAALKLSKQTSDEFTFLFSADTQSEKDILRKMKTTKLTEPPVWGEDKSLKLGIKLVEINKTLLLVKEHVSRGPDSASSPIELFDVIVGFQHNDSVYDLATFIGMVKNCPADVEEIEIMVVRDYFGQRAKIVGGDEVEVEVEVEVDVDQYGRLIAQWQLEKTRRDGMDDDEDDSLLDTLAKKYRDEVLPKYEARDFMDIKHGSKIVLFLRLLVLCIVRNDKVSFVSE